ncbi:MAG: hypothetical protein PHW93_01440 [Candidatus Methanomethylophilaceae archaeon]|nr:hypothetical protein [Candidatus Methanomethylophilaceae archaeon]
MSSRKIGKMLTELEDALVEEGADEIEVEKALDSFEEEIDALLDEPEEAVTE